MSDHENSNIPQYPGNWRIASDFDPNDHLMNLKGKDYLNVQNRLLWFIRDQRDFIVRGLATTSYVIRTELVEQDREAGYAHFKTYVRDVLGNEAVMYGSESVRDFGDYAEKASTKSLGRALLALGYGTAFAPEMDEGERVVDTPVERKRPAPEAPQRSSLDNYLKASQPVQPAVNHDAEHAAQPWLFLQDVEFRQAMNRRNIRDVAGVTAFVASATNKLHESVTYADRAVCMEKATSLEGLAGAR